MTVHRAFSYAVITLYFLLRGYIRHIIISFSRLLECFVEIEVHIFDCGPF